MNFQDKSTPPLPVQEAAPRSKSRWPSLFGAIGSVIILSASLFVLWRISHEITLWEIRIAFSEAHLDQVGWAILLTMASYLLLTGYDALALRHLHVRVPYRTTALASFTSYAVSFTLGFPLVTGGTVRYWIYAPKGISAGRVAALTVIAGTTFWLGMGVVLGWSLMRQAPAVAELAGLRIELLYAITAGVFCAVAGYLFWIAGKRRVVRIQGWRLELPGLKVSLGQMCLGIGDVCAAAGVLYVLLPVGHTIGYETFLAIYVCACMLGIVSHAPGGIGVFEATILIALSSLPKGSVIGALLLFRLIYYVAPFVLALALLGAYEISGRLRALASVLRAGEDDA